MTLRLATLLVFAYFACRSVTAQEPQTAPPESGEMRQLFNGQDLIGWDGDPRLWSVKDGAIHGETTEENPAQGNTFLLWQDGKTKDFELRLSFRYWEGAVRVGGRGPSGAIGGRGYVELTGYATSMRDVF